MDKYAPSIVIAIVVLLVFIVSLPAQGKTLCDRRGVCADYPVLATPKAEKRKPVVVAQAKTRKEKK